MRYQTPGKERCLLSYMTGESTFKTNGRTAHIGSGGPINRPITPNKPNSRIAFSSPRCDLKRKNPSSLWKGMAGFWC